MRHNVNSITMPSTSLLLTASVVCFGVISVGCSNVTEEWKMEPGLAKMQLAIRGRDRNKIKLDVTRNNSRSISPTKLTTSYLEATQKTRNSYDLSKKSTKKDYDTMRSKKESRVLKKGFPGKKKLNVTESKDTTSKSNLRMGGENTAERWPKVQKRRLRQKEYCPLHSAMHNNGNILAELFPFITRIIQDQLKIYLTSNEKPPKRSTRLNMMQMDDSTDVPYQFVMQGAELNESLNPYNMKQQMKRIMAKYNNANATVEVIGRTLEYNDIVLVKITEVENKQKEKSPLRTDDKKYEDDSGDKKVIFIVHGLAVMGMFYLDCLTEEAPFGLLLSYYLKHLNKFDIFLIPMANPDGYAYKEDDWNKNLSPQSACPGVALDRNFDVAWNTSPPLNSCSQQYPGPGPFSEPESRAVRDVLHRYTHKIIAYIHVHGGMFSSSIFKGDAVLYPKGYTDVQTDDDKYIDMKGEIDEALRRANFQVYSVAVEPLYNWYGHVSGTSVDYASTVYGIPYAMEFVMQIFEEEPVFTSRVFEKTYAHHALVEVWKRVIDVVFNNIWNSLHTNDE